MPDYSGYILITYAVSGAALLLLGLWSFRAMKAARKDAEALRRRRKGN